MASLKEAAPSILTARPLAAASKGSSARNVALGTTWKADCQRQLQEGASSQEHFIHPRQATPPLIPKVRHAGALGWWWCAGKKVLSNNLRGGSKSQKRSPNSALNSSQRAHICRVLRHGLAACGLSILYYQRFNVLFFCLHLYQFLRLKLQATNDMQNKSKDSKSAS
jgi:hypothetical protein